MNVCSYDSSADFKNVIGFCVAASEMVELELDFWGYGKPKLVAATNFGTSLAEGKWESVNLT